MSGSFSNYLRNKILDHFYGCGTRNYTPPANIYLAFSTTAINADGTGITEPSGGGYARLSTSEASWNVAANNAVSNSAVITSAEATADQGTLTHFAQFDAASGGNMLAYGTLAVSKQVRSGDTLKFNAGDLVTTHN